MNKPFKPFVYLALALLVPAFMSCDKKETPERTAQDEMQELQEMLRGFEEDSIDIDTTELGVYYFFEEEGEGPYPEGGDTLFMQYYQYINGVAFESSFDYNGSGIWKFIYLYQDLPTGFNDAIALMNKGTKITILVPSHLAYGEHGTARIPPYTTLQYKAEMHDIKQKKKVN